MTSFICNRWPILFHQVTAVSKVTVRSFKIVPRASDFSGRQLSSMAGSENYAKLFSGEKIAEAYARFRPEYNTAVFDTILDYCAQGSCKFELAVDVGCGSGQSTLALAARFKEVVGIDVSQQQIKNAQSNSNSKAQNISFREGPAEDLGAFDDGSVDLITCAQALHWMDHEKLYPEVSRVLRPGGSFAAYGYGIWCLDIPAAEDVVTKFYKETLNSYWGQGRKHVEEKYARFSLPFPGWIRHDDIWQEKEFSVDDFCGFISSWSAYHKYKADYPEETELSGVCKRLKEIYADGSESAGPGVMRVRWPVFLLMGRKPM